VPDDGLHPKVDVGRRATHAALQLDALTRAIDRATQASMDSVTRVRLASKKTAARRP
jgi:hypothetical protein